MRKKEIKNIIEDGWQARTEARKARAARASELTKEWKKKEKLIGKGLLSEPERQAHYQGTAHV
jgi:hypothetical protein